MGSVMKAMAATASDLIGGFLIGLTRIWGGGRAWRETNTVPPADNPLPFDVDVASRKR